MRQLRLVLIVLALIAGVVGMAHLVGPAPGTSGIRSAEGLPFPPCCRAQ